MGGGRNGRGNGDLDDGIDGIGRVALGLGSGKAVFDDGKITKHGLPWSPSLMVSQQLSISPRFSLSKLFVHWFPLHSIRPKL